jgi:hypothetical protein
MGDTVWHFNLSPVRGALGMISSLAVLGGKLFDSALLNRFGRVAP